VRAIEDEGLVEELRTRRIPLEVCPSSNVCLGVFPSMAEHTFDRLHRAGVPLSINSDDPPMFETTLTTDYERLRDTFGYTPADLAGFALASVEQSFLPAEKKSALLAELRRDIAVLAENDLGEPIELPADVGGA
jgi:adenosine deaminase